MKYNGFYYNIIFVNNRGVSMINTCGDIVESCFSNFKKDDTFAGSAPFGVKIVEESYE